MYKINKYPDGTSYVTIPKEWEGTHQEITFRVNTYEDLWNLNQLCEVLNYNHVSASITIPCLIDAQADMRFNEFQSSSLVLIADLFNEYKHIHFYIFHPHNPGVVEALFDKADCIDNSEFIEAVLKSIQPLHGVFGDTDASKNLILMSSDAGGFKPLMKLCDKIQWAGETFSASKARVYKEGSSELTQLIGKQDFEGKDILIVDDICVYGGTFKGLSKLLKERNCGKLYLAVSHMTIQNLGDDPVTNYFDKVFTTNSKFNTYYSSKFDNVKDKLEIIKMFDE